MARVVVTVPGERVVEEFTALVSQPTTPSPLATPPHIGVVEISQSQPTELIPGPMGPAGVRGSRWYTGDGPPSVTGALLGDIYLDNISGDVWVWDGDSWEPTGTNIQGSPDTPAQVLAKIVQVDGAGSGLDADLLDGQHGAYYATDADMTAVETKNSEQDGRLTAVENVNATQNNRLTTIEGVNTGQDTRLTNIETKNTAQDSNLATINADQVTQNNRMTAIESVNTAQDTAISGKVGEAPSDGLTYGRKNAAWSTIVGGAVVSDTAPGAPLQNGQLWFESDTGNTFIYVTDANSSQWVQQNVLPAGQTDNNVSTAADMSIGFRTSGNRFVVNDKADMSGTDVMTVSETGEVTASNHVKTTGAGSIWSAGAYFIGSPSNVLIGPNTGGTSVGITLRPFAYNSSVGQTVIDSVGTMSVAGNVNSAGSNTGTFSTVGATYGVQTSTGRINSSVAIATTAQHHVFYNTNGQVGSISTNASATAFTTSSDERLKNVGADYDPVEAIAIIRADPVKNFQWKAGNVDAVGWIAQRSYAVHEDLATRIAATEAGEKGEPAEDEFWGIDYGKRTPYLWAALTHALDKIEALEARLAALEAPNGV